MKVKVVKNEPKFNPFDVLITFETNEEIQDLFEILGPTKHFYELYVLLYELKNN